jgi:hypothetical protein
MTKKVVTNNGKQGGWLVGKRHYDKSGKSLGGIKAVVTDAGGKPVELEGGEVIINREASKKYWKELSKINQSAGNGVAIEPPTDAFDEDPSEDYENGGKIEFNANHIPNKWILNYAIKIKEEHPDVWALGGNIFGNQAFINLKRVAERGHWLDSEEWMYKKWRSFVARHKGDFRIAGVIAMLKWVDKVDKGWQYMKNLIEEEIKKREARNSKKMNVGGNLSKTPAPASERISGSKTNPKGTAKDAKSASSIKFDENTLASIKSLIDAHNDKYSSKKITLAVAKAVVRRGMGAYSGTHRPTITGGKPNSRTAWGLARLKAFIYKAQTGKSKSGKYSQDNDLFEELNISVQKMNEGGRLNDCIDFIKNSEAIKNNGYYLEFKNLSIYIGSGDKVIPKIKSIFLITYNSGGQKNLKPIDTINSIELANKLANLLNVEIGVARIIVSEQVTHSKRFEINKINSIVSKNIIIADRDTIVCTNLPMKLSNGGDVRGMSWYSDFKKQQLKKGTEHELEHADTIAKFKKEGVSDRQVAEQIAKDHLEEDENYYIELDKMEGKKFATGGLVTDKGGEAKVGDIGFLETRNGIISIYITGITDKKVRFKIISDNNRPDSNPVDRFMRNYRGPGTGITTPTPTPTPAKGKTIPWTLDDFAGTKIIVDTPEKSKKFQELILALGGKWGDGSKKVELTSFQYLYIDDDLIMTVGTLKDDFDKHPNKEIFFDDIFGGTTQTPQTSGEWRTKTEEELRNDGTLDSAGLYMSIRMEDLRPLLGQTLTELNASPLFQEELDEGSKYLTPLLDGWGVRPNLFTKKPLRTTQTNVAEELSKYRIKTKVELEMEFGINWRTKAGWVVAGADKMDWLFGKPITEIVDKADYDSVLDKVVKNKRFDCSKKLDPNGISWNIFREAYKYDPQVAKPILSKESLDELFKEVKQIDKEREALEATPKKNETQLNDELKLLEDEYNDLLFLISITPSTDVDNMIALKLQAKQLKEKIDLLHLDLKKKIDGELQLLDNLFNASSVQPQERYKFNAYSDGFAPDGQPTSLPKNLYDWTMSQEFQNWFGNFTNAYNYRNSSYENVPCSVVVNKNYEPLVVYHGTGVEFSFFKFDKFPAMYFAENEAYSNWFAELKGQQAGTNGYVYPFLLNIRTPLDLTIYGIEPVAPDEFIDWMFLQTGLDAEELKISKALLNPTEKYQAWMYLRNSPEMLNVLRDKAICDGIIYYEDNPSVDKSSDAYQTKAYIVFNSNSAKIADPNREMMTIPAMRSFYLKRGGKL